MLCKRRRRALRLFDDTVSKVVQAPNSSSGLAPSFWQDGLSDVNQITRLPPIQIHSPSHSTTPKCLFLASVADRSPHLPRKLLRQRQRSRWSPTCSTSPFFPFPASFVIWQFSNCHLLSHIRLVDTCTRKCIPPQYREADLNKGESMCLDRCVAKFFEVNVKVSEKMQGEAAQRQGAMGGGGGSMFG